MARQAITAPTPRPPRYGLVAAAPVLDGPTDDWVGGFKFAPEGCGDSGRVAVECQGNTAEMDTSDNPGVVEGDPFAVWANDTCSSFGFEARDYQGRATRALEASRSFQIAEELWTGTLSATMDDPENRALINAGSDTLTEGPTAEVAALACLEQGLAQCGQGRQGMVHMTPQLLTHLAAMSVVSLQGTTWLTPNGHLVVPDAGYPGSGPGGTPAGDSQWAYATSMIGLRLGPVDVIPGSLSDARAMAAALDRGVNTISVWAVQLVAYQWDECCHLAAEFDVPTCLVGGAS